VASGAVHSLAKKAHRDWGIAHKRAGVCEQALPFG